MVALLSQCFQLESEITKKENGNFYLPHKFGLNNISSSFSFYNYTSKGPAVCMLKSALSEDLTPDLQGHLAKIQACMVSK